MEVSEDRYPEVMDALGENTRTVIPFHFLLRRQARVWADNDLQNVIIETATPVTMVFIFGPDPHWQAEVLQSIRLQRLYWCPVHTAGYLMKVIQPRHQRTMIFEPDIQRTTRRIVDIAAPAEIAVKRIGAENIDLACEGSEELEWLYDGWDSRAELIEKGILIGAVDDGRMIAAAVTFARSQSLDDIGIATDAEYRGRGIASACAARLVAEILDEGRQPVWTVFESNTPSVRISRKLGFQTQTRCTVIRAHPDED